MRSSGDVALDAAIRAYWDERIHDVELSADPPGSAAFYAALDAYRLRKNGYLLESVGFDRWAGRDVLEIGCGAGLDLVRFARGGARVTGVDVASGALELARGYCDVAGVRATLLEADGACLPLSDNQFDLVYCHGVLPFARDPAAIVAESQRVLRAGGTAIFMVYNRRSWMNLAVRLARIRLGHGDAPGFRLYGRDQFAELVAPFKQSVITVERLSPAGGAGHGIIGRLCSRGLRSYGWHLVAHCRKTT
ncbi:MAG TPA: methyltransferase domain-containing protein [Steroidobacteraceae bacterium]|nr:methyltransferase domain-containing protein [Steroidobacteraceae bacterium]